MKIDVKYIESEPEYLGESDADTQDWTNYDPNESEGDF